MLLNKVESSIHKKKCKKIHKEANDENKNKMELKTLAYTHPRPNNKS